MGKTGSRQLSNSSANACHPCEAEAFVPAKGSSGDRYVQRAVEFADTETAWGQLTLTDSIVTDVQAQ